MKRFLYLLVLFTWGLGPAVLGFAFFLANIRCPHKIYRGAIETQWKSKYSGLSLGPFIFTPTNPDENYYTGARTHEYGHTFQCLVLGPFYAIVGVISVTWGSFIHPLLVKKGKKDLKYTTCFVEYNASWLGEKITGEKSLW